MFRGTICLAVTALLAGCSGGGFGLSPSEDVVSPVAVASLSQWDDYGYAEEGEGFEIGFGARAGLVMFLGGDSALSPRMTVGAFATMFESDNGRLEAAVELAPDLATIDRSNMYIALTSDYTGFLSDTFYWKAGGGGLISMYDDKSFFLGVVQGGAGLWFPIGEETEESSGGAIVANAMLQLPLFVVGGTNNGGIMLTLNGGYEF